jgi:hypothetical protein
MFAARKHWDSGKEINDYALYTHHSHKRFTFRRIILWTQNKQLNSVALVCKRTIPTERPQLVGEVSANFCGCMVSRGQRNKCSQPYSRFSRPEPLLFHSSNSSVSSRGWMDPVPDPLLLRESDSAVNQTRDPWICSQELWPLDHRGGLWTQLCQKFPIYITWKFKGNEMYV